MRAHSTDVGVFSLEGPLTPTTRTTPGLDLGTRHGIFDYLNVVEVVVTLDLSLNVGVPESDDGYFALSSQALRLVLDITPGGGLGQVGVEVILDEFLVGVGVVERLAKLERLDLLFGNPKRANAWNRDEELVSSRVKDLVKVAFKLGDLLLLCYIRFS